MKFLISLIGLTIIFPISAIGSKFLDQGNDFSIFQPGDKVPAKFYGDISIGGSLNTGNSNSYNLNTKLDLNYNKNKWVNTGTFQSQIGGDRTTGLNNRNYNLQGQSKYFFKPPVSFWYGFTSYTLDTFNTYRTVSLNSLGYGQRLLNRKDMTLDLEGGPSYTRRRAQGDTGLIQTEMGILGSVTYNWIISDNIKFTQFLLATRDKLNTYTQSTTSLTSKIIKNLALSISLNYEHNTNIPLGSTNTEKTDTQTLLSVVYGF